MMVKKLAVAVFLGLAIAQSVWAANLELVDGFVIEDVVVVKVNKEEVIFREVGEQQEYDIKNEYVEQLADEPAAGRIALKPDEIYLLTMAEDGHLKKLDAEKIRNQNARQLAEEKRREEEQRAEAARLESEQREEAERVEKARIAEEKRLKKERIAYDQARTIEVGSPLEASCIYLANRKEPYLALAVGGIMPIAGHAYAGDIERGAVFFMIEAILVGAALIPVDDPEVAAIKPLVACSAFVLTKGIELVDIVFTAEKYNRRLKQKLRVEVLPEDEGIGMLLKMEF